MSPDDTAPITASLRRAGLLDGADEPRFTALTGGVASDIWLVEGGPRLFVVKRALERLRVAADWRVPQSRNASEVVWLRQAARVVPAPEILLHDEEQNFFAMEYLEPSSHPVWKGLLREGRADIAFAAAVGRAIRTVHAATAGDLSLAPTVNDSALFRAIRLEPYLEFTAGRHPDLAEPLHRAVEQTLSNRKALVHGDVSPKNILAGPDGPVFLDAECAWYGDPAFDIAFCLNHMLLKCLWVPAASAGFLACFDALAAAYLGGVDWEPPEDVEARAAALLPGLLLARIDGKSPVEYVTDDRAKAGVRAVATPLIEMPPPRLADVRAAFAAALPTMREF